MNTFDAVVTAFAILAIVIGFMSGLLRSLATILGYLLAAPFAIALTPRIMDFMSGRSAIPPDKTWVVLAAVFAAAGIALGALFRGAVTEFIGPDAGLFDRVAGAALGAVRTVLLAVLIVVVFDRIIPAGHEPPFLVGSKLRPYLSAAGQEGLETLPPDVENYIDRLKRERGF
ncbi:MAG TPA: CvpA family protein [Xanthobacteraceae bacterium]|nr:CvpA family protein [Xanthobacteraceae bacterium]